jgi:hypothetical protein
MAKRKSTPSSELASLVAANFNVPVENVHIAEAKPAKAKPAKLGMHLTIGKDFKPRTDNIGDGTKGKFAQQHNWDALVNVCLKSEDGIITYEEAVNAVLEAGRQNGYEATCNARGFVQGRVRGGHLITA